MSAYTRHGPYSRLPSECKRHRPVPVINLTTGKPVKPASYGCWFCGAALASKENPR